MGKIPAGYKQTEVGVIPEEWTSAKVGNLVKDWSAGVSVRSTDDLATSTDDVPLVLKTSAIRGGCFFPTESKVVFRQDRKRMKLFLRKEMILISRMNTVDLVGDCGIVNRDYPLISVPDRLWGIQTNPDSVNPAWLNAVLASPKIQKRIRETASGTSGSMKNISKGSFQAIMLPLPPLSEQKRIAQVLGDVDALIQKLEALIAKKRDIKQAAMQELLTGKRRLPGFSGAWETKRLGAVCKHITTGRLDANAMKTNGDYPFFSCARERYQIDKYAFDGEALLVSGNGANVGYVHHYIGKFNAYQRTYVLMDFNVCVIFVKLILENNLQERLRTEVNAGNTPYIVMDTLTGMIIYLPPDVSEQTAIAQVLSDMDTELAQLESRLAKTMDIKAGLMQELLTGKIRLVTGGIE